MKGISNPNYFSNVTYFRVKQHIHAGRHLILSNRNWCGAFKPVCHIKMKLKVFSREFTYGRCFYVHCIQGRPI